MIEMLLDGAGGELPAEEREWNNRFQHLVVLFGDAGGARVFRAGEEGVGRGILGSRR